MNSTVWYEQIEKGLKDFINNIVTLPNNSGVEVPVPVRVRKADEDFKKEDYPMVTIYPLLTSKRDEMRYYPFKVLVNKDISASKGTLERSAVPYSITYQIDFFSTLKSDMNLMLQKWCFEVGRDFNLPVLDSGGNKRTAHVLQKGEGIQKQDKLNDNSRIFNSVFIYRIWAELDEENSSNLETCDIVTDINITDGRFNK